jgi:hypothetical protein
MPLTDKEMLTECLDAFIALSSQSPSPAAKKLLKIRRTPRKTYSGTSAYQLATIMAKTIREHLAKEVSP